MKARPIPGPGRGYWMHYYENTVYCMSFEMYVVVHDMLLAYGMRVMSHKVFFPLEKTRASATIEFCKGLYFDSLRN